MAVTKTITFADGKSVKLTFENEPTERDLVQAASMVSRGAAGDAGAPSSEGEGDEDIGLLRKGLAFTARVGTPIAMGAGGTLLGGPGVGYASGVGGAGLGELLGSWVEGRKPDPLDAGAAMALTAVPMGLAGKLATRPLRGAMVGALEGGMLGGGYPFVRHGLEGELPSKEEVIGGTVGGALLGAPLRGFQGAQTKKAFQQASVRAKAQAQKTVDETLAKPTTMTPEEVVKAERPYKEYPEGFVGAPEQDKADLVDKAGNINFNYIDEPQEGVKAVIYQIAKKHNNFIDERRGVVSEAETRAAAEHINPLKLLNRKLGQPLNDAESLALRELNAQSASNLLNTGRKALSGNLADLTEFVKAQDIQKVVQGHTSGSSAEIGRALHSHQYRVGGPSDVVRKQMKKVLDQYGGIDRALIAAEHIAKLGDPDVIAKYVAGMDKASTPDKLFWLYLNGLLSNPSTWTVNFMSNAATSLFEIADTGTAAALGKIKNPSRIDKVYFSEVEGQLTGMVMGVKDALKAVSHEVKTRGMLETLKTGLKGGRGGGVTKYEMRPIKGRFGSISGIPVGIMSTTDDFFRMVIERGALNGLAIRESKKALRLGRLKKEDAPGFITKWMAQPPEFALDVAERSAHRALQTRALGATGRAAVGFIHRTPGLRWLIPFTRTPMNLLKWATEHSPAAPLLQETRDALLGRAGAVEQDLAMARVLNGTFLTMAAMWLADKGYITGGGSLNTQQANVDRAVEQPYSVKFGNKHISYARLDPFAFLFGAATDYMDLARDFRTSDDKLSQLAAQLIIGTGRNFTSKTYMQAFWDLFEAIQDPSGKRAEAFIGRMVGGAVVPAGVAQAGRVLDPHARETREFSEYIQERIPGVRAQLAPRTDVTGQELESGKGLGPDIASPFYERTVKDNPVLQEMQRLGMGLGYYRDKEWLGTTYELPAQFRKPMLQRRHALLTTVLGQQINAPTYQQLTPKAQKMLLRMLMDRISARVQKEFDGPIKRYLLNRIESGEEERPARAQLAEELRELQ